MVWGKAEPYKSLFFDYEDGTQHNPLHEAVHREGADLCIGEGRVDAKTYYQMIGTGGYETSGYYLYSATNIRLQEMTFSYTMPDKWFANVLKDVTVSFIANNPWMLYCKAPFDPELTPSTSTYGQGNDYFMQPSVRSFGFGIKFKL
jgi:hypothetical protein